MASAQRIGTLFTTSPWTSSTPQTRTDQALGAGCLSTLDRLEVTYGALPSILATRADYLDDEDPRREELLLQAYALAESRHDTMNLLDVAHSLANCTLRRSR